MKRIAPDAITQGKIALVQDLTPLTCFMLRELILQLCETSEDYELLTRKIFKEILESAGVENIDVRHNVRIKGKSGVEHQIDVFWEYKYTGVTHKILIECKYYSNPVSLIHSRNMLGLLTDIPNSQGLIVTTQGYQSGVIDFCDHYEIKLKKIRSPQGSDWDDYIQVVNIEGEIYQNQYKDLIFSFDKNDSYTKAYIDEHGSDVNFKVNCLEVEECAVVTSIGKWLDSKIINSSGDFNVPKTELLEPDCAYVIVSTGKKLKIKTVAVPWVLTKQELSISIDAMDFVHAVLEDFNSGGIEYTLNK